MAKILRLLALVLIAAPARGASARSGALAQLGAAAGALTPGDSCALAGSHSLADLRALAARCPRSPFARAARDLSALDREDPRLLDNLGRAGIRLRIDSGAVAAAGGGALYLQDQKTLVLADSGEYALYELAHAVDDVLLPDDSRNLHKTLKRLREQRRQDPERLLPGLENFLTAWDSKYFETAHNPVFLEAYKEYIRQVRAGKIKMSWTQDDVTRLIETYMWAFGWYWEADKRAILAREAPLLHAWVQASLRRLGSLAPAP